MATRRDNPSGHGDPPPERNKGGRPYALTLDEKIIDQIRTLASIQCTTKEASAVLGVSEKTFLKFKAEHPEVAEVWAAGPAAGRASLRRHQFALAQRYPAMAIFLGKNLLGQRDRFEIGDAEPLDLSKLNDAELAELERLTLKAQPGNAGDESNTGQQADGDQAGEAATRH